MAKTTVRLGPLEFKVGIDWRQKSTIRGAIWVIAGIVAISAYFVTADPAAPGVVLSVAATVAGGLGLGIKD